jgi:catechol 2,3-dioxygenase-like lactoylglutathione lyase family enzyme
MFERFTEQSRRALFFARFEATQAGSVRMELLHLVLGILREDPDAILRFTGGRSPEEVRKALEGDVRHAGKSSTRVEIPFSDEFKRALERAREEADAQKDEAIRPGHLLMGVLAQAASGVAGTLRSLGVEPAGIGATVGASRSGLDLAHIIGFVPTRDFAKAQAFFEKTLGLRLVNNDGFALVFDANGTMLRVVNVKEFTPFPFTLLGWNVPDIETSVKLLEEKGVRFERYGFFEQDALGVWTAPSGEKVAWFKDPDGNTLSLSQHVR